MHGNRRRYTPEEEDVSLHLGGQCQPGAPPELEAVSTKISLRWKRCLLEVQPVEVISDEDFLRCWKDHAIAVVHGKHTIDPQPAGAENVKAWYTMTGKSALPEPTGAEPPVFSCTKGFWTGDDIPNQDNFSVTYFKNGWKLAVVADGHGVFGHLVSSRAVQSIPYFLAQHMGAEPPGLDCDFRDTLVEVFKKVHEEIVSCAVRNSWDCQASGSTALAVLYYKNVVYVANLGDSRCVIGYEVDRKFVFATQDHKPNFPAEQARLQAHGSEVRSQTYPDGWTAHRVFVKGEDYPGLAKSRTLGDQLCKAFGVIATPDVTRIEVDRDRLPFVLLASDGIWEFLDTEFVVKAAAKKLPSDGLHRTLQKLQREARKRWKQEEGDNCDDMTAIFVRLE